MVFRLFLVSSVSLTLYLPAIVVHAKGPAYTRPNQAKKQDADFLIQGEYVGEIDVDGGTTIGSQIVALGAGKFLATTYFGGLPGEGWNGEKLPPIEAAKQADGSIVFQGEAGQGVLEDGVIRVVVDGSDLGVLKKVNRKSKTLGKKPPKEALVLFDGRHADHWEHGMLDRKTLTFKPREQGKSGLTSKAKFGDHSLHIEFRLPYMPEARGQGRGNSGIYLQGRYEVQMLDSFGLEGEWNECGGIYRVAKPKENMCFPPLTWQTYDIDFMAARYDNGGQVVAKPKITVWHNGVQIHKDLELPPQETTAAPVKAGPEDGPIYLQDHGNPVRYRNIWVLRK